MNNERTREAGRRHSAAIRFTTVKPLDDRIEFEGTGDDGKPYRFSIGADTLRALGRDNAPDMALLSLFEGRKPSIFAVASRAFNAGVRGDPIDLPRGLFRDI